MAEILIDVTKKCRGIVTTEACVVDARDCDEEYECVICDIERDACETYDEAADDPSLLHTTWTVEVIDDEGRTIDRDVFTVHDFS